MYTEAACAASAVSGSSCTAAARSAIQAKIYEAVSETNQTYRNSSIEQRLSLVYVDTIDYTEADSMSLDLDRLALQDPFETLKTRSGPYLEDVHDLRDRYAADAVVMVTKPTNLYGPGAPSGISTQMKVAVATWLPTQAFAVVPQDSLNGVLSFGHELGHVMGADHNAGPTETAHPFPFSHGFVMPNPTSDLTTPWRTVMAESTPQCPATAGGCIRLPTWSNPLEAQDGDFMGIPNAADNVRALNSTAETVANYRTSSVCGQDVWMKDTWQDTGAQPDPWQAQKPMWNSPDIWVRNIRDADGGLQHQHEHQNPVPGATNWAYVKVHNGGPATTGNLELRMNNSLGIGWPLGWSVIESKPLALSASSTTIEEFRLAPGVNPSGLLARWVSASDPMKTPEGPAIESNTRANNNIVWRNGLVMELGETSEQATELIVENPSQTPTHASIDLLLRSGADRPLPRFAKITVTMDEALARAWSQGGRKGSGYELREKTLQITAPKASLRDVNLAPGFEGKLRLTVSRVGSDFTAGDSFTIDVVQSQLVDKAQKILGGVRFDVRAE